MSGTVGTTTESLNQEDVIKFHKQGYLGPIRACSPSAAREFVETFETEVLGSESDDREASPRHDRHLDSRSVYEFLTQSSIVETIRSIYGSDLLLWSSHFWEKEPGEEGVPWHQERHFSAVEPPVTATIDLALDPVDETSGCMGVIPGSHERAVPHTEADGAESQGYVDSRFVEEAETVRIGLDPGEFVLYNARLLHRTYANETDRRRRSLSCRMTIPEVRIDSESPLLYSGHQSVVVSGTDGHGLNETTEPPASGSDTDR